MWISFICPRTVANVAVICKNFYALTLMKEPRFKGNHASKPKAYETCVDKNDDELISSHDNSI